MVKIINDFLNKTTMYKVLMYGLFALSLQGLVLSGLGILSFNFFFHILTLITFIFTCWFSNEIISRLLKVQVNSESAVITSLILFLIIQPAERLIDLFAIFLIAVFAMATKYLLVANKIHIFNPAAIAALLGASLLDYIASWWVGSMSMLPLVLIVGLLILKKVRRFGMALVFIFSFLITIFITSAGSGINYSDLIYQLFTSWPIIFFATVMLTEPLTMPGSKNPQLIYSAVIGVLLGSRLHLGPFYASPELALVIGNLGSFIIQPRNKYILKLKEKIKLSPDIYEFIFTSQKKLKFNPGQYIEWTYAHEDPDTRGNRRYFTIASSPNEESIKLGIRMNNPSSSFKNALQDMQAGDEITAAQIAGDFTLDEKMPAVFIAGGIGITPFRSMVKYLMDNNRKQDVTLIYFAKKEEDFVFKDIFEEAKGKVGLKVFYIVSDRAMDLEKFIKDEVPNYSSKKYYLSGPSAMVDAYKMIIKKLVPHNQKQIVTDYFPGF